MNGIRAFQQTARRFSTTNANREKNQFLVVLKDFTDDKALERRLSVRERHLEKARQLKLDRVITNGGAIFDNHQSKRMEGSFLILNADTEEEVKKIVTSDIYYTSKVWDKIEIFPIKAAPLPKIED